MKIVVETPIASSPRVQQVRGMFDLPAEKSSRLEWRADLPLEEPWHIGLIVGPSGCGKSTLARHLFPGRTQEPAGFAEWTGRGAVVDAFPAGMPIKEIVLLLSAVGFASPPAWLRPYRVLSTGQQFRVALALRLAYADPAQPIVFDEYTSVVDRTVAQIGSAAVSKLLRARGQRFVAVTCHEDVAFCPFSSINNLYLGVMRYHANKILCFLGGIPAMIAYSYIRFSSKRQAKGDSRKRQLEDTERYCQRHGLTLADENYVGLGVSAHSGKHLKECTDASNERGLWLFLEGIRQGKIRPGSYLVIENLDRLSREEIDRAMAVFSQILRAGITICTTSPERQYTQASLQKIGDVLECVLHFVLANEESNKKSERLRKRWETNRREGRKIGGLCPSWLQWKPKTKEYILIPEKAKIVKKIFELAATGIGSYSLIRHLNERGISSIGTSKIGWHYSYISLILRSRAAIGERVYYRKEGNKRVPDTIDKNHFPPVVDEGLFYRVQDIINNRTTHFRGRGSKKIQNLFAGLLYDARDGGSLTYNRHPKYSHISSSSALRGISKTPMIRFPYEELETSILIHLKELVDQDFFDNEPDDQGNLIAQSEGELARVRSELHDLKKEVLAGRPYKHVRDLIEGMAEQEGTLLATIEVLRAKNSNDKQAVLSDVFEIVDEMVKVRLSGDKKALHYLRERLQGSIRRLLESVYLLIATMKAEVRRPGYHMEKRLVAELRFRSGKTRQFALRYHCGEVTFVDWEPLCSLTELPNDFKRNDPGAILDGKNSW